MKTWIAIVITLAVMAVTGANTQASTLADTVTVIITGNSAGPTPFINNIFLTVSQPAALKSVKFTISPKAGSVTRPVSATYSSAYLVNRGYYSLGTGQMSLPVFGLYHNRLNPVTLTYVFTDDSTSQSPPYNINTAFFNDPCGIFNSPNVVQARTAATDLSYDFILLKSFCSTDSPVILDTDGEVRWVGTAGAQSIPAIIFANGIYVSSGSRLVRMEFDGVVSLNKDYSGIGVTSTGHHNYDPGKNGFIMDVNTTGYTEAVNIEVDKDGNVLKTWNLAEIIKAQIDANPLDGDPPASELIRPLDDWFHNNATTYRASDNTLIVSGREDFVIAIDYDTGAIKWILGDTTKKWGQYPSLRALALKMTPPISPRIESLPPIGQHALSITKDDNLLLFDNGRASLNQSPIGIDRNYSSPRKYRINTAQKLATVLWDYTRSKTAYSPYCSSCYEDAAVNYLIEYAILGEVLGLNASGQKIFHYQYPAAGCNNPAWNARPAHLENMVFP